MTPSVGRIVHYVSYGTPGREFVMACRAAVVTEVLNETTLSLAVLNPTGMFFNRDVGLDEGRAGPAVPLTAWEAPEYTLCGYYRQGGTWHWPQRDPGAAI